METTLKRFIGPFFFILVIFIYLSFIKSNKQKEADFLFKHESEINEIKIKLSEIEKIIKPNQNKNLINKSVQNNLKNSSPIKSITFRIGSNDDRLRIYWEDGQKTDLPCSKEESIWVCG